MFDLSKHVDSLLAKYLQYFGDEKGRYDILEKQLQKKENISTRKNFNGHVTASAYILSTDKQYIAIVHNINLDKWLAPGGHWEEGDMEIYNTAKREAEEEIGLNGLELFCWHTDHDFIPIDIDSHFIPENKKKAEKDHFHHDFRYIFIQKSGTSDHISIQTEEIKGFEWINISCDIKNFSGKRVLTKIQNILLRK